MPKDAKPGDDGSKDGKSGGDKSADKSGGDKGTSDKSGVKGAGKDKAAAPKPAAIAEPAADVPMPLLPGAPQSAAEGVHPESNQLVPQVRRERVVGKLLSFQGRQAVAERGVAQPEEHGFEHEAEPNPYAGWLTVH